MRDAIIQRLQRQLVECQETLAMERLARVQNPMELLTMHVPTLQELEATGSRRDADPIVAARSVNPQATTTFLLQPTSEVGLLRLIITTSVVSMANGVTMTTTNTVDVPINMMANEVYDESSENEDAEDETDYAETDHDDSASEETNDFISLAWGS
jgi:hypothetical protein